MTEQRIRRLKTKIQNSRTRLLSNNPFFALLLMYIRFIAIPGMKKISTDGRSIYFSPDFLDRLYGHEVDFILCHQIMHIICGHIWCPDDLQNDNYHYACDILVNRILEKMRMSNGHYSHLGLVPTSITGVQKDVDEMTPDEIVRLLPYSIYVLDERSRNRFLADSDIFWNVCDQPIDGVLILDIPEREGLLQENDSGGKSIFEEENLNGEGRLKQIWQERTMFAAKSITPKENKDADYMSVFIKRMINKFREPTVDWKKILNNFIQERICDYSFLPPDRRFTDSGFFLPDFNEKDFSPRDILFMVDTSGSVDDDTLAAVYSEIIGAVEQFSGKLIGKLCFFDSDVFEPMPFASVNDLLRIVPHGGGGTDFRPIFKFISNHYANELPACIVIFTDGYGTYPLEKDTLGVPVLWLLMNSDITPPFGKVTRIIT